MTVTYLTLDQTIEERVATKAAGAPGKEAMGLPVRDRNGRCCATMPGMTIAGVR